MHRDSVNSVVNAELDEDFQQALRVQEKVSGKTHPDTLDTIMNMAVTYAGGLKDFVKAEQMFRQALDGFEKALGKGHKDTKECARNLIVLIFKELRDKVKAREVVKEYPHLIQDPQFGFALSFFIR